MQKTCEICGATFECGRNKKTCSKKCSDELARRKHLAYYHEHKAECDARNKKWREDNKERYREYQHNYNVARWARDKANKVPKPKKVITWSDIYNKADRLTKLSMLSLALTEHNLGTVNYGYLSFIYGTDEYKRLEDKVFKAKEELVVDTST